MEVDNTDTAVSVQLALKRKHKEDLVTEEFDEDVDSPALFRLTGKAEVALLRWVSVGEGGLQGLLNLRRVSQTTKAWIDDLLPLQGRRLFCKAQVKVDGNDERSVADFLVSPPPSHVTSLSLHAEWLHRCEEVDSRRFLSSWTGHLESLEVDELPLPLRTRLQELVSSGSLRSFRCRMIGCREAEFSPINPLIRETHDNSYSRCAVERRSFFRQLAVNQSINRLHFTLRDDVDVEEVATLINVRRYDTIFQLTLTLKDAMREGSSDVEKRRRFVTSVVQSTSSIRLLSMQQELLNEAVDFLGVDSARKFWRCVKSMPSWDPLNDGYVLALSDLTNLTSLQQLEEASPFLDVVFEFPENLEHLGFQDRSQLFFLPGSLTSADVQKMCCSIYELWRSLTSLQFKCPLLETLSFSWKFTSDSNYWKSVKKVSNLADELVFPNLRSLTICAEWMLEEAEETTPAIRALLLEGFGLPRLPLTTFVFKFNDLCSGQHFSSSVFDVATLTSSLEGPVMKNLRAFDVDKRLVEKEALPLLRKLENQTDENRKRRRETHGRHREEWTADLF